jgi:hypothetical protein
LPEKYFPTVRILINKQLAGISRYLKGCDKISIIKHGRGVCLKTENIPVEPDWQETGVAASGTVHQMVLYLFSSGIAFFLQTVSIL